MPALRNFIVRQIREVEVSVVPEANESYAAAALRVAESAFENPGEPDQGMNIGVHGMPAIITTEVTRKR